MIAVRVPVPATDASSNKKLPPDVDLNDVIDDCVNQYLCKSAEVVVVGKVFVINQFNDPELLLFEIVQSLAFEKSELQITF